MRNHYGSGRARSAALAGLLGLLGSSCVASGNELRRLAMPDQFHLSYSNGRADIDSKLDSTRGFNEEGSTIAFGLSWNLSEDRGRDDALRRDDLLQLFLALRDELRPAPAPESAPERVEPAPEPVTEVTPEPEPIAEVAPEPPLLEVVQEPVVELIEPVPEPTPREEPALIVVPEKPPELLATLTPVHLPQGLWPWWPVVALATGTLLAFMAYAVPGKKGIVRDRRALASRAR